MAIPYYHVDAFTGELFAGNPARVMMWITCAGFLRHGKALMRTPQPGRYTAHWLPIGRGRLDSVCEDGRWLRRNGASVASRLPFGTSETRALPGRGADRWMSSRSGRHESKNEQKGGSARLSNCLTQAKRGLECATGPIQKERRVGQPASSSLRRFQDDMPARHCRG
jgi:hypothetical protein